MSAERLQFRSGRFTMTEQFGTCAPEIPATETRRLLYTDETWPKAAHLGATTRICQTNSYRDLLTVSRTRKPALPAEETRGR